MSIDNDEYINSIIDKYTNIISSYLEMVSNKFKVKYESISIDSIQEITGNNNKESIYEVTLNIKSYLALIIESKNWMTILENKLLQIWDKVDNNNKLYNSKVDNIQVSILEDDIIIIYYNLHINKKDKYIQKNNKLNYNLGGLSVVELRKIAKSNKIPLTKKIGNKTRYLKKNELISKIKDIEECSPGMIRGKSGKCIKNTNANRKRLGIEKDTNIKKSNKITPSKIITESLEITKDIEKDVPEIIKERPSKKQMDELSNYFGMKLNKYYEFRGRYTLEWGWLLWLEKKLGSNILCTWKSDEDMSSGFSYHRQTNKFVVKPWVYDSLSMCFSKDSHFIVGIIAMQVRGGYHANALIFDTKNNILTRFEPHGSTTTVYDRNKLDTEIKRWLNNNYKKFSNTKWIYRSPVDFCPVAGPQSRERWSLVEEALETRKVWGKNVRKESQGFCAAWSLLYIHMRVVNPEYTDKEIVEKLLSMSDKELSYKIREYAEFIINNVDKNWNKRNKKDSLKEKDLVKVLDIKGNVKILGKIISIKQTKALVWVVYRKGASKHKTGKILIPISMLINIPKNDNLLRRNEWSLLPK